MIFNYDVSDLNGAINNVQGQIVPYIQTGTTASRAYAVGECFALNGTLYRVTSAIANGGTITIGTNAVATTVKSIKTYTGTGTDSNGSTATVYATVYDDIFVALLATVTTGTTITVGNDWFNGIITFTPSASFGQCALAGYSAERPLIGVMSANRLTVRNTIRDVGAGGSATVQGMTTFIK